MAQQVAQQYATPPPPKKEKKEKVEKQDKEKPEKDKEISPSVTKKNTNKKTKCVFLLYLYRFILQLNWNFFKCLFLASLFPNLDQSLTFWKIHLVKQTVYSLQIRQQRPVKRITLQGIWNLNEIVNRSKFTWL